MLSIHMTPSCWYGENRRPLRVFLARLYCPSTDILISRCFFVNCWSLRQNSIINIHIFFGKNFNFTHGWRNFLLLASLLLFGFGEFIQMFPVIENLIPKFSHDRYIGFPPFGVSLYIGNIELFWAGPIGFCWFILNEVRFFQV